MLVDILIIVFTITSFWRGREIGFIRQVCSTAGFIGGLFLGAWLQPHIIGNATTTESRALLASATTLGCALLLLAVAESIGIVIKMKLEGHHKFNRPDIWLGAVAGGLTLLLTVWLSAPVLEALPFPTLKKAMDSSRIVSQLDTRLPSAPGVISKLGRLIYPNGFPQVFIGLEPTPDTDTPLPDMGDLNTAVRADRASVVKVEGKGCGGIVEGSGFVAADGFVATNAHVVAGIANPTVLDGNGRHQATAVWFDYNLDLAVLRVNNLAGKPLKIDTATAANGTAAAVLGYPGGGNFTAGPASVMDSFTATGRNIYNQGRTDRSVYSIKATVIPGNSGGPLIEKDGDVIGLIFATSTSYDQVGYALTMAQVQSEISQAVTQNQASGTGQCASE